MWMRVVVLIVVRVILGTNCMDRSRSSRGASLGLDLPGINDGSEPRGGGWMTRASFVIAASLCAAVAMPQTAAAAGSYGAVVEKGFRGCATAPESAVVICFQSPSVSSQSKGRFLQAWRAVDFCLAPWNTEPATWYVRAVSVRNEGLPANRPVLTYLRERRPRCA